ncbi:F-box/WD repeat-containing protein [Endozoicomonas ascidiicola]|uniref:F-box/WD repeat-containing protein n=1 Tax=Endozoicomonas ascidiicola TaxID=1698521 RepID=UPI00082C1523|nr:F-box protein [Endozoicomonas ascidiicola]
MVTNTANLKPAIDACYAQNQEAQISGNSAGNSSGFTGMHDCHVVATNRLIDQSNSQTLKRLPEEVLSRIFQFTSLKDRCSIQLTCKAFKNIGLLPVVCREQVKNSYYEQSYTNVSSIASMKENPNLIRRIVNEVPELADVIKGRPFVQQALARHLGLVPAHCTGTHDNPGNQYDEFRASKLLPDGRLIVAVGTGIYCLDMNIGSSGKLQRISGEAMHDDMVMCLVIHTDGRLASASVDGKIKVWKEEKKNVWACSATFCGPCETIWRMTFLTDDILISTSGNDIILWDFNTHESEPLEILKGHKDRVMEMIKLTGSRFLSVSDDATARVWDLTTDEKCIAVYEDHSDAIWDASVFPDGRVATPSRDGTVRVWDTNILPIQLPTHVLVEPEVDRDFIRKPIILSDSQLLTYSELLCSLWDLYLPVNLKKEQGIITNGCKLAYWHRSAQTCKPCIHVQEGRMSNFSYVTQMVDGRFACVSSSGEIMLWDAKNSKNCRTHTSFISNHIRFLRDAFSLPDGRLVTLGDSIIIWDY